MADQKTSSSQSNVTSPVSVASENQQKMPSDNEIEHLFDKTITFLDFNQDNSCFSIGTQSGFCIYNSSPLRQRFLRNVGPISLVQPLYKTNIVPFVGGLKNQKYPPNKVIIWDDQQVKVIAELGFLSEIRGLKIRRDRIVIAIDTKVYVYRLVDLRLMQTFETCPNPWGLLALSPGEDPVLVTPSTRLGMIRITIYDPPGAKTESKGDKPTVPTETEAGKSDGSKTLDQVDSQKSKFVQAHENRLAAIAINSDGSKVATASERGTLIRVFDTSSAQMLHEFRRGLDTAEIYSMSFSWNPHKLLAVASNKGTLHIFSLTKPERKGWVMKGTRGIARICPVGLETPGTEDRWTVAFLCPTIITDDKQKEHVTDPDLIIVSTKNKYYRYHYDYNTEEIEPISEEFPVTFI